MRRELGRFNTILTALIFGLLLCESAAAEALRAPGQLQWTRRVELGTPLSGVVVRTPVRAGQRVKKETGLVYLDQRGFEAQLSEARAKAHQLKLALAEAKRELERSQKLYDRTLLSDHDLQLAKIAYANAQADYEAAHAALVQAQLNMDYSVVRAPFDALVLTVSAQPGQTVVSRLQARTLVTVAEAGKMSARALVSEKQLSGLATGQKAKVSVGGHTFPARIHHIGLEAAGEGEAIRYPVDAVFDYDPARTPLRAGQQAEVILP